MLEIERKFELVPGREEWRMATVRSFPIVQGYFSGQGEASVRVRISGDASANLNIKSSTVGLRRLEYEYPIPVEEARELLENFCAGRVVEKTRHLVPAENGLTWEIDEYHGPFEGHFTAEIEVPDESTAFARPVWLGAERTGDARFANAALAIAQRWPG